MQVQKNTWEKKYTQTYLHLQMPYMDVQILSQIKEKTCKHIFKNNYKCYLFYKFAKKNMEHDKKEIAMPIASISIVYYTWLVDSK